MKINRLDAHDRFQHFTKQSFDISECCQDLIRQRPFGDVPYLYIFAHPRTDDDGITKRLLWQPRLTRPRAQSNSMLFKAYPKEDMIRVIWMIPDRALWDQYTKGKMMENKTICDSIYQFQNNWAKLEERDPDDLTDLQIDGIYRQIARSAKKFDRTL
jgi:hypothetical protein